MENQTLNSDFTPDYRAGAGIVESLDELTARLPQLPPSGATNIDQELRTLHATLSEKVRSLVNFANSQDPTQDQQAFMARVQMATEKLSSDVQDAQVKLEILNAEARHQTETAFSQHDGLETQGPHAAELRSILRGMTSSKRLEFLNAALEAGDRASLAAMLRVPPILSGLDPATHSQYLETWRQRTCPGIVKARERHAETATNLQAVLELAGNAVKTFHGRTGQRNIAQARQRAEAAAQRLQTASGQ